MDADVAGGAEHAHRLAVLHDDRGAGLDPTSLAIVGVRHDAVEHAKGCAAAQSFIEDGADLSRLPGVDPDLTGSARIALKAGVPLVPAALEGTGRLSRLAKLKVSYGEPVPVDDLKGRSQGEAHKVATQRLMERISSLREAL